MKNEPTASTLEHENSTTQVGAPHQIEKKKKL
jgi:hypothetical protein